jgi:hypothetical protein
MSAYTHVMPDGSIHELHGRAGAHGSNNRMRASHYARAEYYAWAARRSLTLCGNDPIDGHEYSAHRIIDRRIGRAAYAAAAREAFRIARETFANPLSREGSDYESLFV